MQSDNAPATHLMSQPGAGTGALLDAIDNAKETIHIVVFRFDRRELEMALKRAARRGVFVHALVAHTSAGQGGAVTLRKLEMGLLADGITVTRTASDLVRYHAKLMIVDHETLFVLGFNFTYLDIDRSRSFGVVTRNKEWVDEAEQLFLADATRQQYTATSDTFIVSPGNSRSQLMSLLESAKDQILIYDGKLSDTDVMKLISQKVRAGLDVRVIGSTGRRAIGVKTGRLFMRLHAQVIICDSKRMFLGSQSLRTLELDARREAGVILSDPSVVGPVLETFEADWRKIQTGRAVENVDVIPAVQGEVEERPVQLDNRILPAQVASEIVKEAVKEAIKDAILERAPMSADAIEIKDAVKNAAREALHELAT